MALMLPAGRVRLTASPPQARVHCLRQLTTSAALPRGAEAVNETSSFFQQDSRPIMLFDGNSLPNQSFYHLSFVIFVLLFSFR